MTRRTEINSCLSFHFSSFLSPYVAFGKIPIKTAPLHAGLSLFSLLSSALEYAECKCNFTPCVVMAMMSYVKEIVVLSGILKELSYWNQHPSPPMLWRAEGHLSHCLNAILTKLCVWRDQGRAPCDPRGRCTRPLHWTALAWPGWLQPWLRDYEPCTAGAGTRPWWLFSGKPFIILFSAESPEDMESQNRVIICSLD